MCSGLYPSLTPTISRPEVHSTAHNLSQAKVSGVHLLIGTDIKASGPYGFTDRELCELDPVAELYLEGDGSSLRLMMEKPEDLFMMMEASGMIQSDDSTTSQREQDELLVDRFMSQDTDWIRDSEILEEIEWFECCEPSYFTSYDMSTGESPMICGTRGSPTLHDASRHEQQCNLNDLVNPVVCPDGSMFMDGGTVRTADWEKDWVFEVPLLMDFDLVATGPDYAVGLGQYGAAWIPKSCIRFLPALGETFRANARVSRTGKYPLRVMSTPGNILVPVTH
jgi:hypothetical protein